MAMFAVAFLGSGLVGGPAFGALAQWLGVSGAMDAAGGLCAVVALAAATVGWFR
jgi:hypothetical protein